MLAQQGKEIEAVPLLEDLLASESPEAGRYRNEASYLLGVARFKAGRYDDAARLWQPRWRTRTRQASVLRRPTCASRLSSR